MCSNQSDLLSISLFFMLVTQSYCLYFNETLKQLFRKEKKTIFLRTPVTDIVILTMELPKQLPNNVAKVNFNPKAEDCYYYFYSSCTKVSAYGFNFFVTNHQNTLLLSGK